MAGSPSHPNNHDGKPRNSERSGRVRSKIGDSHTEEECMIHVGLHAETSCDDNSSMESQFLWMAKQ